MKNIICIKHFYRCWRKRGGVLQGGPAHPTTTSRFPANLLTPIRKINWQYRSDNNFWTTNQDCINVSEKYRPYRNLLFEANSRVKFCLEALYSKNLFSDKKFLWWNPCFCDTGYKKFIRNKIYKKWDNVKTMLLWNNFSFSDCRAFLGVAPEILILRRKLHIRKIRYIFA